MLHIMCRHPNPSHQTDLPQIQVGIHSYVKVEVPGRCRTTCIIIKFNAGLLQAVQAATSE